VLWMTQETSLLPLLFVVPTYADFPAYLNWSQLKELEKAGCMIGGHGMDHANLRQTADDALDDQIGGVRSTLEKALGVTVNSFCYPFGSYDDRVLNKLANSGYRTGYTLNPTYYQQPDAPYQIGRTCISYDLTLDDFAALLPYGDP